MFQTFKSSIVKTSKAWPQINRVITWWLLPAKLVYIKTNITLMTTNRTDNKFKFKKDERSTKSIYTSIK